MTKKMFRDTLLASTMIVGVGSFATPALAQGSQPTTPPPSGQGAPGNVDPATQGVQPQEATGAAGETSGGEIVVTGTLIKNPNLTSSSPVNVVGQSELQLRNTNTAEEVLRSLPGAVPGIGAAVNNGSNGTATIDLRGLGTARNLVLLDGVRVVPATATGITDLNNIPLALVERIDVLTGGASTTYGADAVSGVVNFVTRRNFTGVELSGGYRITENGDGARYRTELTVGGNFDGGRGNAVISVGYQHADPIYQGDRDISVYGISSSSGVASGSSFTSTPTTISFASQNLQVAPAGGAFVVGQYAGFNFNPYNIFQTPFKRWNTYGALHYDVSDRVEVYARTLFSRNIISSIIAPSGIFGNALTVPANNPYLSATQRDQLCTANGIALGATCNNNAAIPLPGVYRRTTELGPRISEYTTTFFDNRAGVRFKVTENTSLDVSGSYGDSDLFQRQTGYVLTSRVQQALNATNATTCTVTTNNCVPLNLFGPDGSISAAQAAFIAGASTIDIKTKLSQARALYSGDIGTTLPWATQPISFAVGGEWRRYRYQRIPDNFAASPGELGGAGGAILPFSGGYSVKEGFGELIAPIAADRPLFKSLTLETGIRYSSYNVAAPGSPHFNTTAYKFGGTWDVVEDLRIRGNYQRAVRAPNISELFAPVVTGLTNLAVDPCAGAAPVGNANLTLACINQGAPAASIGSIQNPSAGQANATGGGNPNIKPEKADTWTVGAVLRPSFLSGFSASIDYYHIVINNAITAATPGDVIAACFGTNAASITAAQANSLACTTIRRNPANGRLSGNSATTFGLPTPLTNNGRLATDGIDFTANYTNNFGPVKLNVGINGNYTRHLRFRASPTGLNRECVGYYSANCGPSLGQIQPKFSFQQRTTLSMGPADLSLLWRHLSAVRYEPAAGTLFSGTVTGPSPLAGGTYNFNRIPAYNYFDLALRFQIGGRYDLTLGVQNLLNKQAPLVGSAAGSTTANSGNTFPSTYDVYGRSYNVNVRVRF